MTSEEKLNITNGIQANIKILGNKQVTKPLTDEAIVSFNKVLDSLHLLRLEEQKNILETKNAKKEASEAFNTVLFLQT